MITAAIITGLVLAAAGLGGLVWCILTARKIQKGDIPEEQAMALFPRLSAVNMASVGGATLGLAILLVSLLFS